jgi:hypothetical protein
MTPLCWEFIWRSITQRIPIGEASQCDIAWHWFDPENRSETDLMQSGDQYGA